MIDVLVADDEAPALDELGFLLRRDPRIGAIHRASSGAGALRLLERERVDAAFLDIHMPGLSGFDLARGAMGARTPPAVVFVTADEDQALAAFDLAATDYLLKPVREERLAQSITRVIAATGAGAASGAASDEVTIAVTLGTTIRRIRRGDVLYAQAQGDYARLHTEAASYLLRMPLSELEQEWAAAGFLRVHRSFVVAMAGVTSIRVGGHPVITVGGVDLPISRRLLPAVRDALTARSSQAGT